LSLFKGNILNNFLLSLFKSNILAILA